MVFKSLQTRNTCHIELSAKEPLLIFSMKNLWEASKECQGFLEQPENDWARVVNCCICIQWLLKYGHMPIFCSIQRWRTRSRNLMNCITNSATTLQFISELPFQENTNGNIKYCHFFPYQCYLEYCCSKGWDWKDLIPSLKSAKYPVRS